MITSEGPSGDQHPKAGEQPATTGAKTAAARKSPAKKASSRNATPRKKAEKAVAPDAATAPPTRAPAKKAAPRRTSAKKAAPRKATAKAAAKPAAATSPRARTTPRREHDLVVFGASGFTGRLVSEYLSRHAPHSLRVALAGRNPEKLYSVRDRLAGQAAKWPLVVADSDDAVALRTMAASTTAVITTVGPYLKYGLPLVEACAMAGTNYGDLTGEVVFMRESIDRYTDVAAKSGARIVHSCGFDSIPSDLGVLALHLAAKADDGEGRLTDTQMVVTKLNGGISGGTIASGMGEQELAETSDRARKLLSDPYALSPDRKAEPNTGQEDTLRGAAKDEVVGVWVGPFLMAGINQPVVRRSNALLDYAYGKDFHYREVMSTGPGPLGRVAALAMAGGYLAGGGLMRTRLGRQLAGAILPDPGEGPTERIRANGRFEIIMHTRTQKRVPYRAHIAAQGDPGYAATAMMLGQSGLTLAGDQSLLPKRAGVLTPATALGETLIHNLKAAGMTITAGRV